MSLKLHVIDLCKLLPMLIFSQTLTNNESFITIKLSSVLTVKSDLESTGGITNNGSTSLFGNFTMNGLTTQYISGAIPINFDDFFISNFSTDTIRFKPKLS